MSSDDITNIVPLLDYIFYVVRTLTQKKKKKNYTIERSSQH